jgi:hypothetical protein
MINREVIFVSRSGRDRTSREFRFRKPPSPRLAWNPAPVFLPQGSKDPSWPTQWWPSVTCSTARRGTPRTAAASATQSTLAPAAWRYCLPTGDLANEMFAFADTEPLRGAFGAAMAFGCPCRDAVPRRVRKDCEGTAQPFDNGLAAWPELGPSRVWAFTKRRGLSSQRFLRPGAQHVDGRDEHGYDETRA